MEIVHRWKIPTTTAVPWPCDPSPIHSLVTPRPRGDAALLGLSSAPGSPTTASDTQIWVCTKAKGLLGLATFIHQQLLS